MKKKALIILAIMGIILSIFDIKRSGWKETKKLVPKKDRKT